MPGMNSGLSDTNPVLVAAFKAALLHQGLAVIALLVVMALVWLSVRRCLPSGRPAPGARRAAASPPAGLEPAARRALRIGFGVLWIFDGLLQAQSAMPARLPGPERPARRPLRIGFGVLWIFDGLLQAQSAMPAGLPGQVIVPAAAG